MKNMSLKQNERLNDRLPLAVCGVKRPWHLLVTELVQKNTLIRGYHKLMMSSTTDVKENAELAKSLGKLYEDVEQLEIKLKKARKDEEDKPSGKPSTHPTEMTRMEPPNVLAPTTTTSTSVSPSSPPVVASSAVPTEQPSTANSSSKC
jgi:cytoskeletal protein RodZ